MAIATPPTPIQNPTETPLLRRVRPLLVSFAAALIGLLLVLAAVLTLAGGVGQLALFYGVLGGYFLFTAAVRIVGGKTILLARAVYMVVAGAVGVVMWILNTLVIQAADSSQNAILWIFFALAALYVGVFYLISVLKSDPLANIFYFVNAAVIVLGIVALFYFIGAKMFLPFFGAQNVSTGGTVPAVNIIDFLTRSNWDPAPDPGTGIQPSAGAWPLIYGSVTVMLLAVVIATPLSIAAALFLTEVAPNWARQLVQPALELFTGVPSVLYGFVGLTVLVPWVGSLLRGAQQHVLPTPDWLLGTGEGILVSGFVLSIMILPTITSLTVDALKGIPNAMREASAALGATRWQTMSRVLLPAASSGILTGVILGMGRAIGETLAVQMVIGDVPAIPRSIFGSASTITAQLLEGFGETVNDTYARNVLWALTGLLLLISLAFVIISRYYKPILGLLGKVPRRVWWGLFVVSLIVNILIGGDPISFFLIVLSNILLLILGTGNSISPFLNGNLLDVVVGKGTTVQFLFTGSQQLGLFLSAINLVVTLYLIIRGIGALNRWLRRNRAISLERVRQRARAVSQVALALIWGLSGALVILLVALLLYLLLSGVQILSQGGQGVLGNLWHFLTATPDDNGIGPEIFSSFYMLVGTMLIAVPVAMGAAIYLVEFARQSGPQGVLTAVIRFCAETLAGVPSMILGLFGFLTFVTLNGEGTRFGFSRLAAILTLVLLNLPLLMRISEDAIRAVPGELREASLALGATKFQTITKVILPAALPALLTGVILTAGKVIGETAAIVFTAGEDTPRNFLSLNPLLPSDTLTIHVWVLKTEASTASAQVVAAGTAAVLVIFLLIFNLSTRFIGAALYRRLTAGK
ncbi:MAG TPA: phosphate ABC transporter permease subunit PstC [Ktedonobacterales bacterium]|nr:phosphate ABC transporter permease subunit PstC [Ktedonobacterales bacterium]